MITFGDGGGFWQVSQRVSGTISQKLTWIWDCSLLELLLFNVFLIETKNELSRGSLHDHKNVIREIIQLIMQTAE